MSSESRKSSPRRLMDMMCQTLLQEVPFNVAVIDRDYNIVEANDAFERQFGEWRGKKCYVVYKKLHRPCDDCPSAQVFEFGKTVVADAVGVDQHGRQTHYIGHAAPLRREPDGPVEYVLEMTRNVIGTRSWQQEYQILFDRVPCYITVIDREYRIVRANEAFRDSFGDMLNHHCYEAYKRRSSKCPNCPAARTFRDGKLHRSNQIGIESNLTSNVQTNTVPDYASHPIKTFLQSGIKASLSTDDPGISAIDINYEYNIAAVKAGLSVEEIHQSQKNALECAFLSNFEKESLISTKFK